MNKIVAAKMKAKAGDDEAREFGRSAARKYGEGTFKASETGAASLARQRALFSAMGELAKSMTSGTEESEEYIRSGKYKKGGK